ncbi:MBL fold metallo-hydrolase [Neobacillus terrae]|uniref:MBL fold metallo-hydrolase n=1 Tax=Neobacillus terrae TaxID=3034837 RepID=UPI001409C413|nr:MBL fold metallo-hydrolase [Neobacillus terrae]NHM32081.1 MBL fold metallo-hydrolase [Neobacillus terrae]
MKEWKNGIAKLNIPTPFAVGDVNVYVVKGERLTLIDAGPKTDEAWEALKQQLNELGLSTNDIEQIVLTHHHPDHAGLLDYFPDSLPVYGHWLNERWIMRTDAFYAEHEAFHRKLFQDFGLPEEFSPFITHIRHTLKYTCNRSLTGLLAEGEAIPGLSEWTVLETPGHAQSHIVLLRESDGTLIGGDLVLAHISPNPLMEPPVPGETERPKPQLQLNASLKKLLEFPIKLVFTGHGEEVTDLPNLVEKRLERQHDRAMKVKSWLEEEEMTVFEICRRLFPSVYRRELGLTLSETVAQLDYLESIGEIVIGDSRPVLFKAR